MIRNHLATVILGWGGKPPFQYQIHVWENDGRCHTLTLSDELSMRAALTREAERLGISPGYSGIRDRAAWIS